MLWKISLKTEYPFWVENMCRKFISMRAQLMMQVKSQRHITHHHRTLHPYTLDRTRVKILHEHKINMFCILFLCFCMHHRQYHVRTISFSSLWCRKFIKHFLPMNLLSDFLLSFLSSSTAKQNIVPRLRSERNIVLQVK